MTIQGASSKPKKYKKNMYNFSFLILIKKSTFENKYIRREFQIDALQMGNKSNKDIIPQVQQLQLVSIDQLQSINKLILKFVNYPYSRLKLPAV